ncbi:hypothetical protein SEMRO_61_G035230.1 [Seminavis robusta]|uniref:Uncharacterized protein n=1 Tax=Seminavis robusta TaxID=568900 RepID=A0A9N8DCW7_9STRA|nr:hypothetical protein SEMRO_61_G035230.1 [Seminavis robusta]|eukprot:Sro61_g035230.1 n/a (107) ;mRNA; r:137417-137737
MADGKELLGTTPNAAETALVETPDNEVVKLEVSGGGDTYTRDVDRTHMSVLPKTGYTVYIGMYLIHHDAWNQEFELECHDADDYCSLYSVGEFHLPPACGDGVIKC